MIKDFELFEKKFPDILDPHKVPAGDLKKISAQLSAPFADFLKKNGTGAYDKGFIWSVNPFKYASMVSQWGYDPDTCFIVARTAFADMFLWNGKEILLLQVNYKKAAVFGTDTPYLYDYLLTNTEYANEALFRNMFNKALKMLGPLSESECYGFVPALALGGPAAVNNLQKMKLKEYLSMLSQV